MQKLREILSEVPGSKEEGIVFTQCLTSDGTWYNLKSRPATPEELEQGEVIMPTEESAGESGSHNQHARLPPSGSKQWAGCLASLAFIEANAHRIPEDKGSVYANEGTEAHDWAAKVFLKQVTIEEVPENFRPHVKDYVEHCLDGVHQAQVFIEVKIPLFYQTDESGTCDFAAVAKDGSRIKVRDLKYGAGVLVSSMENSQLAIYGLSLLRWLETEHEKEFSPDMVVDIAVFQPRHREGADQAPWVISYADLELFGAALENKARKATKGVETVRKRQQEEVLMGIFVEDRSCAKVTEVTGLSFAPEEGDHGACRWCDAKAFCEARLSSIAGSLPKTDLRDFVAAMPDLTKEEAKLPVQARVEIQGPLDDAFLVEVVRCASGLKKYLEDVHEYLETRVLDGDQVAGTKLVMGREGNRAWTDTEAVDKWLTGHLKKDQRYDYKLKGPAKIEVILKEKLESTRTKNKFESLIGRSPAKKVLALAEDKRSAVGSDVSVMPNEEEFAI